MAGSVRTERHRDAIEPELQKLPGVGRVEVSDVTIGEPVKQAVDAHAIEVEEIQDTPTTAVPDEADLAGVPGVISGQSDVLGDSQENESLAEQGKVPVSPPRGTLDSVADSESDLARSTVEIADDIADDVAIEAAPELPQPSATSKSLSRAKYTNIG